MERDFSSCPSLAVSVQCGHSKHCPNLGQCCGVPVIPGTVTAQSSGCTEHWWGRSGFVRCSVPAPCLSPASCSPEFPALEVPQPLRSSMVKGSPHKAPPQLGAAIPSWSHTCKAHLHHPIIQRMVWGKKLEMQSCGVYSALRVSFATSCLPNTEKSQTPTQASIISMREKLGMEMGARSLDIFPHSHSFALNIQEFKPVPSKKIFIPGNGSSTLPQFNPCYIFLLKEKSKREKRTCRAKHLAKVVCYCKEFSSELFIFKQVRAGIKGSRGIGRVHTLHTVTYCDWKDSMFSNNCTCVKCHQIWLLNPD